MPEAFAAIGSKRDIARTALAKLKAAAPAPKDIIALPAGSPYGRIQVDIAGCTLCLACVGACPTAALSDNPERPQLSFTESACVQCGICVATCPEKVIRLEPRYNFSPAAMSPEVVKAEEPFHCVSCGKPFGTKSTMERVLARLKGKHAMFQTDAQLRLIQMCDTCRIVTVAEEGDDPFKGAARPRVRTTDDYLAEAKPPQKWQGQDARGLSKLSQHAGCLPDVLAGRVLLASIPYPRLQGRVIEDGRAAWLRSTIASWRQLSDFQRSAPPPGKG